MSKIEPGTLKCVIAGGRIDAIQAVLTEHVTAENIRRAGVGAVLVHTPLEVSELRDVLSRVAEEEGESLLVVEFEKWSGFGAGIDREWLLARGH